MRGVVLSAVWNSVAMRSLALSLGVCTFMSGCGDKSTAEKSDGAAPAANPSAAPAGMFATDVAPKLTPVPEDRYAAGDRYADAPRYPTVAEPYPKPQPQPIHDSAVQPAGYATANVPPHSGPISRPDPSRPANTSKVSSNTGGPGLPQSPAEQEFVPGVEDLQLFEQPNPTNHPGREQAGAWWHENAGGLNWVPSVRTNPLPLSP